MRHRPDTQKAFRGWDIEVRQTPSPPADGLVSVLGLMSVLFQSCIIVSLISI